ncbi:hypothetical protein [Microcoleus sp. POL8_C6]|uniref:hypothetical protein n=1 Tax=Microcoleus sp. POL8_C6 TaxID=2818872 RepID=UPI002FD52D65
MRPGLKKLVIPQYAWVKLDLPNERAGTGAPPLLRRGQELTQSPSNDAGDAARNL